MPPNADQWLSGGGLEEGGRRNTKGGDTGFALFPSSFPAQSCNTQGQFYIA
jgi:hypothetical protein